MKNTPSVLPVPPRRLFRALSVLIVCVFTGLGGIEGFAQDSPPADTTDDDAAVLLNQYVVTGSVAPRNKMESPVAITTLDRNKVEDLAPRNLGEMLKAVPGIYVESTGGEAFNNVAIHAYRDQPNGTVDIEILLGQDSIGSEEIAGQLDTIPWEVLTSVSRRVPRFYREP